MIACLLKIKKAATKKPVLCFSFENKHRKKNRKSKNLLLKTRLRNRFEGIKEHNNFTEFSSLRDVL